MFLSVPGCDEDNPAGTGGVFYRSPSVVIETTMGDIIVELFKCQSPETVRNFLRYVDDGFYDGLIFHRVIEGWIVHGGGYYENLEPAPTRSPIHNEADNGLSNVRGTISMARKADRDSATSQFFFNLVDNRALDHISEDRFGYCVFGQIVEGMDVLDAIGNVETGTVGDFDFVPLEPVVITRISRIR
jgi:cyclophilin family peptidyl-prolyl cis-trans isomerase